jgi:hypothetical protein
MKNLKSYKLFESVDEIKSTIEDILRDNVLDKDIRLKIHTRNYTDIDYNNPVEVIKIQIGDDFDDFLIRVDELKDDIITITNYLKDEGFEYNTFSYIDDHGDIHGDKGDVMKTVRLETNYLSLFYKKRIRDPYLETIKIPIKIGDTILGGRFKNRRMIVKKIGKNKKGDITINDKPLLKFRLVKESLQEDVDYYFRHLEDDNFVIQTENDYFRIFKPKNGFYGNSAQSVYSYSNCNTFQWSEIAGEVSRYVIELDDSENSEKSIEYTYIVKREDDGFYAAASNRKQIHPQMLLDETFDAGEILSFTIGFK